MADGELGAVFRALAKRAAESGERIAGRMSAFTHETADAVEENARNLTRSDANAQARLEAAGRRAASAEDVKAAAATAGNPIEYGVDGLGRATLIDAKGYTHVVGETLDNAEAEDAYNFMNGQLDRSGAGYDSATGNGARYYPQDDSSPISEKTRRILPDGTIEISGTTADMIRVTYRDGVPIDVESVDATAGNNVDGIVRTASNKLPNGRKFQAANVVVRARSQSQAEELARRFAGNPSLRVIYPETGFDSGDFGQ
jgi:hypothetical protein